MTRWLAFNKVKTSVAVVQSRDLSACNHDASLGALKDNFGKTLDSKDLRTFVIFLWRECGYGICGSVSETVEAECDNEFELER